ncbi:PREDICTED: vacuolar protein sorting-associated protein 9A-like isoform X3 [Nelumbo nucifera]|uniref:Vacuolar protein sorting-associated protein 9A-like isoform X3 n=1 Tax=Nelumbo nucifera TaxID=4432 RepID=A0A1U7ZV61_NELNU|nr:PREDICTED: vacuolar protein sorting-associated protein 9A-like isoform X3 [Nelumbo nucifera]
MEVSSNSLTFYDFLDRMRHPASLDLVRSIKSFIVSFSFCTANSESDSKKLQDFLLTMESSIRDHPLWAGATEEEIDCAVEFAQKELQKMNAFKAPREKLLCILNCCRVINNLLLNVAMSSDNVPAGADDFLPILIYVTIKANPPQLHSNLKFIQLYRRQSKLISEAAYYFTNLMSAKSFIIDLDAKSLSINESEFQEKMIQARLDKQEKCIEPCPKLEDMAGPGPSTRRHEMEINMVVEEDYPFMRADPGELTVADVEKLLNLYKEVVTKYSRLRRAVKSLPLAKEPALHFLEAQDTLPRQPRQQEAQLILPQQPKQQDASDITEAK